MAHLIKSNNILDGWQTACYHLRHNGKQCFNLILEIDNTTNYLYLDNWMSHRNPKDFGGNDNIYDVVNTIFPYRFYERNNFLTRDIFFEYYKKAYLKGKKIDPRQSWGTYFQRLINYSSHFKDRQAVNQLDKAIIALSQQRVRRNAIVFHLTSSNLDSNTRVLGGPCWQFGELLWSKHNNTIDLLVVYRNHDYFNKTLGNLIGLSKLLDFLCTESGRLPGKIILHSANAYYDCNHSVIDLIRA
jgi:thymidylate synthase